MATPLPMSVASTVPIRKAFFPTRVASGASRWLLEGRAADVVRFSASAAGSAAGEYPEKMPGVEPVKQKKKMTVAGIDQEELVDPSLLADPDSFFCDFNGVQIHHKVYQGEHQSAQPAETNGSSSMAKRVKFPFILLHGFGASVYSWSPVMKPLARLTSSKVLAFDRPGFGLTSRADYLGQWSSNKADSTPLNPYSMAFSMLATLSFIDSLGSDKSVLVGHSAGCIVAANTYFEAPEKIAALILVAPAIVAPFIRSTAKRGKKGNNSQAEDSGFSSDTRQNLLSSVWKAVHRLIMGFVSLAILVVAAVKKMINTLYRNMLSVALRSSLAVLLVRTVMDKFGILAVRNAWYDSSKVTDHVIQGYTKPLKAKGWEKALLEYTLALLTDVGWESKPPLTKRLSEISCPVLIITGDTDRLVPSWNAKRLSAQIPGSEFTLIKNCGHLPHEEKVDEFIAVISSFLGRHFPK